MPAGRLRKTLLEVRLVRRGYAEEDRLAQFLADARRDHLRAWLVILLHWCGSYPRFS